MGKYLLVNKTLTPHDLFFRTSATTNQNKKKQQQQNMGYL
jgi:hypothetical protein